MDFGNDFFFNMTTKSCDKIKIKKYRLIHIIKLFWTAKDMINKTKKQPMKWGENTNHVSHLLLLYKICKEDKEFNNGKTK